MRTADMRLLKEITRRLIAELQPEEIFLFGSYAWGTPDEGSDLDLLVVVPASEQTPVQRASRAYRCLRGIVVPLDILVKTRDEVERHRRVRSSLVSRVLESGKVLYERGKALAGT
jgi:predicted nucleotidyltransferase